MQGSIVKTGGGRAQRNTAKCVLAYPEQWSPPSAMARLPSQAAAWRNSGHRVELTSVFATVIVYRHTATARSGHVPSLCEAAARHSEASTYSMYGLVAAFFAMGAEGAAEGSASVASSVLSSSELISVPPPGNDVGRDVGAVSKILSSWSFTADDGAAAAGARVRARMSSSSREGAGVRGAGNECLGVAERAAGGVCFAEIGFEGIARSIGRGGDGSRRRYEMRQSLCS